MAAAVDDFAGYSTALGACYSNAALITKSDTVDLGHVTRAIYVGGTGDMVVTMQNGTDVTFTAVPAGTTIPIRATRVKSTLTTATLMYALW